MLRQRKYCRDRVPLLFAWKFVATHKTLSRQRLLQLLFSLLSYCTFLIFELKPTKHKVGKYSIIWHYNKSEDTKNTLENWIKNIRV